MNIHDIALFSKYPTKDFEEEVLYDSPKITFFACKVVKANRLYINFSNPETFRCYGYFVMTIYNVLPNGSRVEISKHSTYTWHKFDYSKTSNNLSPVITNSNLDKFLNRFSSVNRIIAYFLKSYMKSRGRKIPEYKHIIKEYEADLPVMELALNHIESLKPARGKKNVKTT